MNYTAPISQILPEMRRVAILGGTCQTQAMSSVFFRLFSYVLLAAWTLVCVFPVYWLLVTSVKPLELIDSPGFYAPFGDFSPTLEHWRFVLSSQPGGLALRFLNSAVIATTATVIALGAGTLALYGLTRFGPLKLQRWLNAMLASRILPPVVIVVPLYVLARATGLFDTLLLMVLVYAAANLPIALWLLQPVMGAKASEQEEAARLEGESHFGIIVGILVPMMRGSLAAAGLLVFLQCWNEYLFAALLTSDNALTLPPWMAMQVQQKEAQVGGGAEDVAHLAAAAVFMLVPALMFAAFVQRALTRSVAALR
jgi:multiple sugar transport system permease protein